MKQVNYLVCHFHYVESLTWLCIRRMVQRLIVARLEQGRAAVSFSLDLAEVELLRDFLEQMDTAYLHPRRDSLHVSLLASQYSNLRVKPNEVRMTPSSAIPEEKKTLSITA